MERGERGRGKTEVRDREERRGGNKGEEKIKRPRVGERGRDRQEDRSRILCSTQIVWKMA